MSGKKSILSLEEARKKVDTIFSSDLNWEDRFKAVFPDISRHFTFHWDDPDISYEEDAKAWKIGFDRFYRNQTPTTRSKKDLQNHLGSQYHY